MKMGINRDMPPQTIMIGPRASETTTELLSMVESILRWRVRRAELTSKEEAVRRYILTQYPVLGRAPTSHEIADSFRFTRLGEVQKILERLHTLDLLFLEPESREIRLAYPFSTVSTKHVVRFHNGAVTNSVYAPCAVDALGISFMLRCDLSIESSCGFCQKPLTFTVRDRMIVACTSAETVLWVGTVYCDHAATSLCPTLDFFCSSAHVAAWRQERTDEMGSVLDLGEGLHLAKGTFEDLLNVYPAGTETSEATTPPSHSPTETI